ncbi:MAG: hypothetical protein ABIR71_05940 [Chthoniobacterales bacterium]
MSDGVRRKDPERSEDGSPALQDRVRGGGLVSNEAAPCNGLGATGELGVEQLQMAENDQLKRTGALDGVTVCLSQDLGIRDADAVTRSFWEAISLGQSPDSFRSLEIKSGVYRLFLMGRSN